MPTISEDIRDPASNSSSLAAGCMGMYDEECMTWSRTSMTYTWIHYHDNKQAEPFQPILVRMGDEVSFYFYDLDITDRHSRLVTSGYIRDQLRVAHHVDGDNH